MDDIHTIDVIYDPTTRRISLVNEVPYGGATIDSDSVEIRVTGIPSGFDARLDFAVYIKDEDHNVFRPFGPLHIDGNVGTYTVETDVLAAARDLRRLPFQLVLTKDDVTINSQNAIVLQVTRAIDSIGTIVDVYRPFIMFLGDSWAWRSDVKYKKGSAVTFESNGEYFPYVSLQDDNFDHEPATSPEYWSPARGPQGDSVDTRVSTSPDAPAIYFDVIDKVLGTVKETSSATFSFTDTTLNIDAANGELINHTSKELKGVGVTADFNQTGDSLVITETDPRDPENPVTHEMWVRGDDLSAEFDGPDEEYLKITTSHNGTALPNPISTWVQGDVLEPHFEGTYLHIDKKHKGVPTGTIVSPDLKGTFIATWVNDNTSLRIEDNNGVKTPVYVRGDDLSASMSSAPGTNDQQYLDVYRSHNGGSPERIVHEWVQGDLVEPRFDGDYLKIRRTHKGTADPDIQHWITADSLRAVQSGTRLTLYRTHVGTESQIFDQDLKGDTGKAFMIAGTPTYDQLNSVLSQYQVGDFVLTSGDVEDPNTSKLYVKVENNGTASWQYLGDLSGAQGIQGIHGTTLQAEWGYNNTTPTTLTLIGKKYDNVAYPTGEVEYTRVTELKGNSLSAAFTGNDNQYLTVTETDPRTGQTSSVEEWVQGDKFVPSWDLTVPTQLNIDQYHKGQLVLGSRISQDLVGPQGPQGIQGIQGIQGETGPQGIQGITGDSVTARFSGTVLYVYQVDSQTGTETELSHADLKGAKGDGNSTTYKNTVTVPVNSSEVSFTNQAGTTDFTWSLSEVNGMTGRTVYKTAEVSATADTIYITVTPSDIQRTLTFNYTAITE